MKIIVIGGTGTIGSHIVKALAFRHEVVIASHTRGNITCDITSPKSLEEMFKTVGAFDACVFASGKVLFEPLEQMSDAKYHVGLQSKLMGQVNTVCIGSKYINDRGSFTLISGILSDDPILGGTSAAMVNGAIDSFVRSSAIELPKGIRINRALLKP